MKKVGDILPSLLAAIKPATRAQQKIILRSVEIKEYPNAVERAYMARELIACTLPHSDPGDVSMWSRRNGPLTLVFGQNSASKTAIGFPYGTIPRLLLYWITSEAVQTKRRRLELGKNLSDFLREIGLNPDTGRGKRGDATRLREQMLRLFRSIISFEIDYDQDPQRQGCSWEDMQIAPKGELWWDPKQEDQTTLWGGWIELGEKFFQAITAAPVPIDKRALRALKQSPLALDLYAWATHKAYTAAMTGKDQTVPWIALSRQFGSDYRDPKNFRKKAIAALRKIRLVYPGLKLQIVRGCLVVLSSSLPAVPPNKQ